MKLNVDGLWTVIRRAVDEAVDENVDKGPCRADLAVTMMRRSR